VARPPVGQRIRKRRRELGRSQVELAAEVGISASYLNLIEHNKRAVGGALLNRIATAIGLDSRAVAGTEEARLIAELGEVATDSAQFGDGLDAADAREIVATSPKAARAILSLYRAYREARLRSDLIGERLGEDAFLAQASRQILALITTVRSYSEILKDFRDLSSDERTRFIATLVGESETLAAWATDMFDFMSGRGARRPRPSPREEIEDFISDRANYFPRLETAATEMLRELGAATTDSLAAYAARRHRIGVVRLPAAELPLGGERLTGRKFQVSDRLAAGSLRFRLARLLATLEYGETLDWLVDNAALSSLDAGTRLRKALASYFAGAVIMPYAAFHAAAEELRHDIAALGSRFDASFEQVCHRLTTLRRPGHEGVPMHFLRTDVAGNISKRFSASGLQLPRYGGACPRWIIHHAFARPGRIVTQVGRLPDGETYLCIAHADPSRGREGTGTPHAVMIGAAIGYAGRFAYADGIDVTAARIVVPVGITCRQCLRDDCSDRAFERAPLVGPLPALATVA
jgi:predicted transcriptional regulator/transcriptional regulator with XRE-family HTH domain